MIISESKIRVRYGETDKMGFVYHANYIQYYEVGRTNLMRELGTSYKSLEDKGVGLPVIKLDVKYYKPSFYDDILTIKTFLKELPTVRIKFDYQIFNENKELINEASITLVFVDAETKKPIKVPKFLLKKIEEKF